MLALWLAPPFVTVLATPILGFSRGGGEGSGSVTTPHFDSSVIKLIKVPCQREEETFGSTMATNSLWSASSLRPIFLVFIGLVVL